MKVRAATAGDAGAVAAIWNGYIRDTAVTFNPAEKDTGEVTALIAARQAGATRFLVAEDAGTVLGFATSFPFRAGPGYRYTLEHTVLLAPEARGRGAGRALMTRLEAAVRGAGGHALVAGVSGENAEAIAFHHAIGFETVGRLPQVGRKFDRWMDLVLMQKTL